MSAMIVTRSRPPIAFKSPRPEPPSPTGPSRNSSPVEVLHSNEEPLEEAVRDPEPPEAWLVSHAEAPDAGKGDPPEFRRVCGQGRSRS